MTIKTLLVDDETSLLDQAEIFLERIAEEIKIQTVPSAEKALDLLNEEDFDVIVSDYQMPEMDGLEFLEELREEGEDEIPFIMFTGKGREEVAMKALNLGADRYLQKGGNPKSQYGVLADAIEQEVKQGSTEEVLELTKYSVDKATPEIYWITEEGKFTYVNETVVERLGYSKEELEGMYIWDVDPNHGKDIRGEHWEKLKEKGTLKFESEHETKEGERYLVEVINHYIKHDGEEYEFAFARDITERKEAERRYRSVIETSPETIAITDLEGKIIECNQKAVELLGLPSKDEIIGKDAFELIAPEDRERAAENLEKTLEKGELRNIEYTILDSEGNEFPGELSTSVIRDTEGNPVSFMAIVRDITDQKEAEEEIKYRENLERIITEISTELMNIEVEKIDENIDQALKRIGEFAGADRSYVFQFYEDLEKMDNTYEWCDEGVEPQMDRLKGLSSDTFPWWMEKLKNFENITIPKVSELPPEAEAEKETFQAQNIKSLIALPMTTDNSLIGFIGFDWVRKEEKWSEEVVDLLRIAGETIASALDRKKAEEKLRESEQRLDLALKGAEAGVWDWNVKTDEVRYSEQWAEMLGYNPDEIEQNLESWEKRVHPDERPRVKEELQKHLEGEIDIFKTEHRMKTKSGDWIWVKDVGKVFERDENGEPVRATGILEDITDRKKSEQKLKESRSRLNRSQKLAKVGSWEIDLETDEMIWSDETYNIFEIPKDKSVHYQDFLDKVHPEDRDYVDDKWQKTLEERGGFDIEHRIIAEGNVKWVENMLNINLDDEGEPVEGIGSIQDITERKEAEEHIEEHQEKLEKLHELSAELQTYDSEEDVYSFAVETAEKIFDFDICSFDAVEGDKFVVQATSSGVTKDGITDKKIEESGLAKKTYLAQKPYIIDDVSEEQDAEAVKSEYRSAISVPVGNEGVFQAVSKEKSHFDEEDLEMALLLANHVSESLKRIKATEREDFLHSLLRHDVGNKNQIVKGYLELMKDYDLPDEVKELVDKAERASNDSTEIIEKVRKLREIEEEGEIGEMDLSSVMEKVSSENQDQLQEKGISLNIDECDGEVKGGPLLKELFSNLVENSMQHSDCDKIRIFSQMKADECLVTVEDDGAGISDEKKEKIFEKGFKKGESAGTGLGLYMVKEIAESYGGSVEVKDSNMDGVKLDVRLKKVD